MFLKQIEMYGFIGIDVANGYTISVIDSLKELREKCPDETIVVGNVVTSDMTQELILAGADIIKVGVGPGVYVPQELKLELVIHNLVQLWNVQMQLMD